MKRTIEITVTIDGDVKVETKGFRGTSCVAAAEELEKSLGKVGSRTPTREWHQGAEVAAKIGGGQ